MAWALKESLPTTNWDNSGSTFTTRAAVGTVAVAVNDTIIVFVPYRISGGTTVTVTDSLGNTYTEVAGALYAGGVSENHSNYRCFYSNVTSAGTPTVTATFGAATSFCGVFASSWSGGSLTPYQAVSTPRKQAGAPATTDGVVSNSVTVATPPALVMGFADAFTAGGGSTLTAGTGYTSMQTGASGGGSHIIRTEYKRVTVSGAQASSWTANFGGVDIGTVTVIFTELSTAPTIQGGTASPVHLSTGNTLTGVNFGASQTGSAASVIGGVGQTETGWNATTVTYTADRGTNLNGVAVNAVVTDPSGVASDAYALTGFQPPAGYEYVTLTSVNSTADYRITAIADLAIGNQLEWDNALVTINADGTYVADPSVTSFNVRVGVTTDGWGSLAVQTVGSANDSDTAMNGRAMGLGLKLGRVVYA